MFTAIVHDFCQPSKWGVTRCLWQRIPKRVADQWKNLPGQREKFSKSKLTGIKVLYRYCISNHVLGHTSDVCLALLFHSWVFKTERRGWCASKLAVFWQNSKGWSSDQALSVPAMVSPKSTIWYLVFYGLPFVEVGFFCSNFIHIYCLSAESSVYLFLKYEFQQKNSTLLKLLSQNTCRLLRTVFVFSTSDKNVNPYILSVFTSASWPQALLVFFFILLLSALNNV